MVMTTKTPRTGRIKATMSKYHRKLSNSRIIEFLYHCRWWLSYRTAVTMINTLPTDYTPYYIHTPDLVCPLLPCRSCTVLCCWVWTAELAQVLAGHEPADLLSWWQLNWLRYWLATNPPTSSPGDSWTGSGTGCLGHEPAEVITRT